MFSETVQDLLLLRKRHLFELVKFGKRLKPLHKGVIVENFDQELSAVLFI
jgi:hypothetical protein